MYAPLKGPIGGIHSRFTWGTQALARLSLLPGPVRLVLMKFFLGLGACAVLVGAGLSVSAAPAQACPFGTVESHFDGVCVSGQGGGGQAPPGQLAGAVNPVQVGGPVLSGGPNELPRVNGVPCTPQNVGTCIGLMQSQGGSFFP